MMQPGAVSRPLGRWCFDGFEVSLFPAVSSVREGWERSLLDSGRALPLPHRASWAALHHSAGESWFLTVADAEGRRCGAVALQGSPSRALPGHTIVRCERFGPGVPPEARTAVLRALVAMAGQQARMLRLHVETFVADPEQREAIAQSAAILGFSRSPEPRSYEHTLLVALEGDEAGIFASLHATARRHIRAADKNPVRIALIEDARWFDRLDELSRETYGRTGGVYDPPDWSKIVTLGSREPSASRLVGLFRTDVDGPAALLAFAWGCGHGDHVHYSRAASTRDTDLRMPLMYPVVWDLMRWAKRNGARHFDFGGISLGTHGSGDPLGGISDFKRYFTGRVEEVGAEWILEPRALQASAARLVSSASSFVTRVLSRRRGAAMSVVRGVSAVPASATAVESGVAPDSPRPNGGD